MAAGRGLPLVLAALCTPIAARSTHPRNSVTDIPQLVSARRQLPGWLRRPAGFKAPQLACQVPSSGDHCLLGGGGTELPPCLCISVARRCISVVRTITARGGGRLTGLTGLKLQMFPSRGRSLGGPFSGPVQFLSVPLENCRSEGRAGFYGTDGTQSWSYLYQACAYTRTRSKQLLHLRTARICNRQSRQSRRKGVQCL